MFALRIPIEASIATFGLLYAELCFQNPRNLPVGRLKMESAQGFELVSVSCVFDGPCHRLHFAACSQRHFLASRD